MSRNLTYTVQPSQEKHCGCGNMANCFITGHGWICIGCYNEAVHEVAYIA